MKRALLLATGMLLVASSAAMAGMENSRFALHWQPKFSATKTVNRLCDDPATSTIEPNYSPNWNSTTLTPNPLSCMDYTTAGPIGAGQVYLVVARGNEDGVAGLSFGVHYTDGTHAGIDPAFLTFTPCSDGLTFPNNDGVHGDFPQQNGGIRLTWNTGNGCPTATQQQIAPAGTHCVVGAFYIYAYGPDQMQITGNNNLQGNIPELAVANCAGVQMDLYQVWGPSVYLLLCGRVDIGGGGGYNPCLLIPTNQTTWGKIKSKY
jgi:hypothetical protein